MIRAARELGVPFVLERSRSGDCEDDLTQLANELDIPLDWEDKTHEGDVFASTFVGTLRPGQREAVDAMAAHRLGVLCAPPGAGKTVMHRP